MSPNGGEKLAAVLEETEKIIEKNNELQASAARDVMLKEQKASLSKEEFEGLQRNMEYRKKEEEIEKNLNRTS